jgi:hypothetical protein
MAGTDRPMPGTTCPTPHSPLAITAPTQLRGVAVSALHAIR